MKKISILIIAKNEEKNIKRLFESIKKLNYPKNDYEIVLVDDASTDNTSQVARTLGMKAIRNKKSMGRAHARNIALKNAKYGYIAWVDADCEIIDKNWIQNMMKHLKDKTVGVSGPHLFPKNGTTTQKCIWHMPGMHIPADPVRKAIRAPTTSSLFLKNPLIEIGGYDENLTTGEDLEICWRLRKKGYEFVWIPKAEITHYYRPDVIGFIKQQFEYGREGAKLLRMKFSKAKFYGLFSFFVLFSLFLFLLNPALFVLLLILFLVIPHVSITDIHIAPHLAFEACKKEKDAKLFFAFMLIDFLRNIAVMAGFLIGVIFSMRSKK